MALTYVSKGNSFEYNKQLGKNSVVEYTDEDRNQLSSVGEFEEIPEMDSEIDEGQDIPDEDPENPPDAPDAPDPEPSVPAQPPSPQPEPEKDNVIKIDQTCTAKTQKGNGDYPTRHITTSSSGFCLSKWHTDFNRCIAYAKKTGVPMFYVWSNGSKCGHCFQLKSAFNNKIFVNYMNETKILWCYVCSCDSGGQEEKSLAWQFGRGYGGNSKNPSFVNWQTLKKYRVKEKGFLLSQYPFVGLYWYNPYLKKTHYDVVAIGDTVNDARPGSDGAKYAVSWLSKKVKNFKKLGNYDVKTATFTL